VLVFFFPVLNGVMGGVQKLILNIAIELDKKSINFKLIDYNNGLLYKEMKRLDLDFVFLSLDSIDNYNKYTDENDRLIAFNGQILTLSSSNIFNKNTKVLIYDVYYPYWDNFYKIKGYKLPLFESSCKKILSKFIDKRGLTSMDMRGLEKFYEITNKIIDKNMIIPIGVKNFKKDYTFNSKERKKICYIGRSVLWKVTPVIKLLDDIKSYEIDMEIHIFTDSESKFKSTLKKFDIDIEEFLIYFYEGYHDELLENEIDKMDMGYSMGTATLECAKRSLPTISADYSDSRFENNYRYNWIYDLPLGNDLGQNIDEKKFFRGKTLIGMIQEFEKSYAEISIKSYQHSFTHYSIENTLKKIMEVSDNTKLEIKDFKNIFFKILMSINRFIGARRYKKRYGRDMKSYEII
jgi:hypothetical protein